MFDRLPTPFGLVRARRRPRPSEDQVGDPRLREDRGARRLPLLRQRRGRPRHHRRRARRALPRGDLRLRRRRPTASSGSRARTCPAAHAATEFVAWYNAHPDFADHEFDLSCERVVVIGNGNVAADVARMLALTREELDVTDTADHAIEPARRQRRSGDRRARPPRAGAGRVHQPRGARAGRDGRRRHRRSTRPSVELDDDQPRVPRVDEADITARKNVEIFTEFAASASPRASRSASCCASSSPRSRSRATARSSGSSSGATSSTATSPARSAPATPASARRSSAGSCCARSATRESASRASPSTSAAA